MVRNTLRLPTEGICSGESILSLFIWQVTVCLQLPSGQRMVEAFAPATTLMQVCLLLHFLQLLQLCDNSKVISKWSSDAGEPSSGEERVVVYTRQEVVGDDALDATSLRLSMTMLC